MRHVCRFVLLAALAVGGCQTATDAPTAGGVSALPLNYRQIIVEEVRKSFFDPYSVRDTAISQPIAGQAILGPTATVCVRANAKNRMGGYTGVKATAFVFRASQLTTTDQQYAGLLCDNAAYEPFPEIDSAAVAAAPPTRGGNTRR